MKLGISVAMCTYNGSRFLEEQLHSIARQHRVPDEVIICDDRSTDNSVELTETFARRVSFPVRIFINDQKLGSTKNFEKAISLCREEIVVLSDQDDAWYESKLARIEQIFIDLSPIAVFSDAGVMDDNSCSTRVGLWKSFSFSVAEQRQFAGGEALNVLVKHPVVTGAAMAFRREFFDRLTPFPVSEIHDRWTSFLLAACGKFIPIPERLMQYRRHSNQQVGVGAQTFRDRLAKSRITGEALYASEIAHFRRLHDHIQERRTLFPKAECAQAEISQKISHLEHRIQLRRKNVARIPTVVREVCNHGYSRYAEGWKSVAKDLFMHEAS